MSRDYGESNEGDDSSGYNRPRRPNVETIAYLRGLPLDIEASKAEISSFLNQEQESDDFPQSLAAALSAIDEVQLEIASLAGDESGSQCLEVLAHVSAPYSEVAGRVLLSACSGYHLHLATHRYGSHVVQTILQLAVSSSSESDMALHEEAPPFKDSFDALPTLSELIEGMVEELAPHAAQLAIHVCGSHVLRTLLCVLGGVDLVSSHGSPNDNKVDTGAILRGRKKSKKKKKRKPESSDAAVPHAGTMNVVYRENSRIEPDEFTSSLDSLTHSLMGEESSEPGELQQLAVHPSAGPLLIVLLRVLTYSKDPTRKDRSSDGKSDKEKANSSIADFRLGIAPKEPMFEMGSLPHQLVQRILCWQEGSNEQKQAGEIIYGLSGEPRGSHLLETLLRLAPDGMYEDIVKFGDFESPASMQDYVEHNVSNFVIQTLLTTIRTKEQAESMLKVVEKVISNGLAVDATKRRRGILWRSAELAAKFRVGQDGILKAMRLGFGALDTAPETNETAEGEEGKKKKERKKASAVEIKDCVLRLIDLKLPEKDGDRINLDAAGTRAVYHMLRFTPRLCEDTLKGTTELSTVELISLAKDGLGSRCIMDGILDGPIKTPIFASATKSILTKLQGDWVSLSVDRVGHHTVKKMFLALPRIDDKAKLVEELANGGNRLTGNTMGRSVVEACFVNEYQENQKEWRKAVSKTLAKEDHSFIDEMVPAAVNDDYDDLKTKSKRKRKRKRPDKPNEDSEQPKKAQPASESFGLDSIMEAMTVPTK
jgi:nucleolar protein 9